MPCVSSRSMVTDPIRIAIPNAIQPRADRKSLRKLAVCSDWRAAVDAAGMAGSAEDIRYYPTEVWIDDAVRRARHFSEGVSGFRNAHGIRGNLGLAGIEQQPGVGLHRRKYRLLRGLAGRRRKQG